MFAFLASTTLSIVITIGVCSFGIRIIPFLRELESPYIPIDISLASAIGDIFLIMTIGIGLTVQAGRLPATTPCLDLLSVVAAIIVALGMWFLMPHPLIADQYHNAFVVPVLVFLLIQTAIVLFRYGTMSQIILAFVLFSIWAIMLKFDFAYGRLDQQKWLEEWMIRHSLR